jgi:hypothetical protein
LGGRAGEGSDGSTFLVYDLMSVALNDILGAPRGPLEIPEVATVCQSIAKGLCHIHEDLKIAHGIVSGKAILLSTEGEVKIGKQHKERYEYAGLMVC